MKFAKKLAVLWLVVRRLSIGPGVSKKRVNYFFFNSSDAELMQYLNPVG